MDFFDRQRRYRTHSLWLYLAFFTVILAHLGVAWWILTAFNHSTSSIVLSLLAVGAIFAIGYGTKAYQLRKGAIAIVQQFNAKQLVIDPSGALWQQSHGEVFANKNTGVHFKYTARHIIAKDQSSLPTICQRFFVMAEQMSIAAGVPMPTLCVMTHTSAINAFVVGQDDDVVLGVTQGALEKLDDDAFLALIAHQFGRIVHGDTLFHWQLLKVLGGLNFLQTFGMMSLTSARQPKPPTAKDPRLQLVMALCYLLTSSSIACGRLIQRLFSQKRTLLADATCVQLTRSFAITKTLHAIQQDNGTDIDTASAWGFLFFADTHHHSWSKTHPSLDKRLTAIDKKTHQAFAIKALDRQHRQPTLGKR